MAVIAELNPDDWHRLNRLLEAALDLEPDARIVWLRALPAGDQPLAPVLERLIAGAALPEGTGVETAQFNGQRRGGLALPAFPLPGADATGDRVGPYRLVRELGQGGMGTVWLAERDDGVFDRRVALKLPRAEWTDRGLAERMARERRALAELNHPNIAQLYDAGWSTDGRPYLALEYVEGEPLFERCRRVQLDVRARLRLFVDVARAVAHAHARLVIHRDLKPGNLMVAGDGRVKLLDFGIAKLVASDTATADETALTRAVGRPLTPAYAAPEQIRGSTISTAADIYALGVVLFELLTGERLYRAPYEVRVALEQAVLDEEPLAPSRATRDRATARALQGDLDTIILKALKKDPAQRYETAAALADDIERHLAGRPVHARADSAFYRWRRFIARHRLVVGSAVVVVASLGAGLVVALWQARAAREQAERAQAINKFVLSIIQQADPVATSRTHAADLVLLTAAEQRVAAELAGRPDLQLQARLAIATAYRNRGKFVEARRTLRQAFDEGRAALPPDHLDLLRARVRGAAWPLVDFDAAQAQLGAAIVQLRDLGEPAASVLIEALVARSMLRLATESADAALEDARDALAVARRHFGEGGGPTLDAATALAMAFAPANLRRPRDMLEAIEPVYRAAVAGGRIQPGEPVLLAAQSVYGLALATSGRAAEGLPLLREAAERVRLRHGAESFEFEKVSVALGDALLVAGDLRGGVQAYRDAYTLAAQREPVESFYRAWLAYQLSWGLIGLRRPQAARELVDEAGRAAMALPPGPLREGRLLWHRFRELHLAESLGDAARARTLAEALLPDVEARGLRPLHLHVRRALAHALTASGDPQRAVAILEEIVAQQRSGNPSADVTPFQRDLALAHIAAGNAASAASVAAEAIAATAQFRSTPVPNDADLWVAHGRALLDLGRASEARASLQRADAFWREFDADSPWAAEAAWLLGKALVATDDRPRGQALMATMRPRLQTSWRAQHRTLVAS